MRQTTLQGDHTAEYELLTRNAGLLASPGACLVELSGEDRLSWLQGQATNDLKRVQPGGSLKFCLTEPTGQLLAACTLWALPERYLIATDAVCKLDVLRRVQNMVILEDVEAKDLDTEFQLFSIQGLEASKRLSRLMSLPTLDAGVVQLAGKDALALRSDRTGQGGWDIWSSAEAQDLLAREFGSIGLEAQHVAALEAGIPRFGVDMGSRTLPPELGPAFESTHISYNKGCYTGQEVLMRIHSRGHTNKTWVGLLSTEPLTAGDRVADSAGAAIGDVTSAGVSPTFGPIAAAMLRNEATAPGTIVQVQGATRVIEAEVSELPFLHTGI